MTVAAFILGIIGTLTGCLSFGWGIAQFVLTGARPKLTPVVCILSGGKLYAMPATKNVREDIQGSLAHLGGKIVVGVEVVNAGRSPFHVIGWAWRTDPSGIAAVEKDPQGQRPPCEVGAGASKTFVTEPGGVVAAVKGSRAKGVEPRTVYAWVSSGGRDYKSRPLPPEIVTMLEEQSNDAP
ncbi:hypothetical protein [Mycobacterium paraseoulense]|uniref:Uncharacterized protein n=1 Tax=Mycobacterium paraseoulense TaxID=590652 RepID=A0A1X0I9S2_9MYCO|nr:hypothetical protein [Mycobacterium paraseoulense]MCV7398058.1 hypothetical protein [Mycobacterium paraseoulense]ORB39242.1 hypothetical protein BST39_15790 [Mycobacterium paraseoulense]BBZ74387.1 hypothetical protein MPRS_54800 [Mycobacterium paraseoulense]